MFAYHFALSLRCGHLLTAKTMRSNQIEASSYQALQKAETEFDALASEIEDKIQKEKETRK